MSEHQPPSPEAEDLAHAGLKSGMSRLRKTAAWAAAAGLLAFYVLPWWRVGETGLQVAGREGWGELYAVPVIFVLALVAAWDGRAPLQLASMLGTGGLSLYALVMLARMDAQGRGMLELGTWLAAAAAFTAALSTFRDLRDPSPAAFNNPGPTPSPSFDAPFAWTDEVKVGAGGAALGLVSFFLLPWGKFAFWSMTGVQLAGREEFTLLWAVPGVFVALGLANLMRRRGFARFAVGGAGALLAYCGKLLSQVNGNLDVVGFGFYVALAALFASSFMALKGTRAGQQPFAGSETWAKWAWLGSVLLLGAGGFSAARPALKELFTSDPDKAIELVQRRDPPADWSPTTGSKPGYQWSAKKTKNDVFFVSFQDSNGSGWSWEVTLSESSVQAVAGDDVLRARYGLIPSSAGAPFEVVEGNVGLELLVGGDGSIGGQWTAKLKNVSGRPLTKVRFGLQFVLILNDESAVRTNGKAKWVKPLRISRSNPWRPGEVHEISLETEQGVEAIYRHYRVTHADVRLSVEAEDPVDYEYDGYVSTASLNWSEILAKAAAGR